MKLPFLFRFGYCTPEQWTANEKHGWDDESSGAFFVLAESEENALAWGNEIANAFVAHLFKLAKCPHPPSWEEAQFASWIKKDPDAAAFPSETQSALPQAIASEMPDFAEWQPY